MASLRHENNAGAWQFHLPRTHNVYNETHHITIISHTIVSLFTTSQHNSYIFNRLARLFWILWLVRWRVQCDGANCDIRRREVQLYRCLRRMVVFRAGCVFCEYVAMTGAGRRLLSACAVTLCACAALGNQGYWREAIEYLEVCCYIDLLALVM